MTGTRRELNAGGAIAIAVFLSAISSFLISWCMHDSTERQRRREYQQLFGEDVDGPDALYGKLRALEQAVFDSPSAAADGETCDQQLETLRSMSHELSYRTTKLEEWATEAVGDYPWDAAAQIRRATSEAERQASMAKIRANTVRILLMNRDPVFRQQQFREYLHKPVGEWTYHEVRPIVGDAWIEWTPGPRNPHSKHRPPTPPRLRQYIQEHPRDTETSRHSGWQDTTIEGGYQWEEFGPERPALPPPPTPSPAANPDDITPLPAPVEVGPPADSSLLTAFPGCVNCQRDGSPGFVSYRGKAVICPGCRAARGPQ